MDRPCQYVDPVFARTCLLAWGGTSSYAHPDRNQKINVGQLAVRLGDASTGGWGGRTGTRVLLCQCLFA